LKQIRTNYEASNSGHEILSN